MAEIIGYKIEVDGVEKSFNSVKELKEGIKELQEIAEESDIGSKQQKEAVEALEKLNEQLKESTMSQKQAAKAAEDLAKAQSEANEEANDLRKQFAKMEDELFLLAGQGKENTEEFRKMTAEAAKLNKRIDAVNSSLGENQAGRATAGFQQLRDGINSLDFDSIKKGFAAMRTALAATGIMLLVQGVTFLVENFDDLKNSTGILGKIMRGLGSIIDGITKGINWLTDAIGATNTELEKMGEVAVNNANKAKEALAAQTAEYDRQAKVASAAGKSTIQIEKDKQAAIIETNKAIIDQIVVVLRAGGQITDEQRKLVSEGIQNIKNAKAELKAIELKDEADQKKKNDEAAKKRADDKKKKEDDLKALEAEALAESEKEEAERTRLLEIDKRKQKEKEALALANEAFMIELDKREAARLQEKIDAEIQAAQDIANAKQQIETLSLNALQSLSDTLFTIKLTNTKKLSAEEEKTAKRQFQINKGLSLASTIVAGYQGVVNALTAKSTIPEPFGQILKIANAVSVGLATAANISKIAATQFDTSSFASGQASATPAPRTGQTIGGNVNTNAPQVNSALDSTRFDEQGNKIEPIKAFVVESESRKVTQRVDRLNRQSEF